VAETAGLVRTDFPAEMMSRGAGRSRSKQVRMSGVGLQIPTDLSYEDWARAGHQLSGIVDSSAWWLGDWLVFGKTHYSDCYQLAIQGAGLRYQTLRNYAWVARRFDMSRRRSKLTFKHHAEVASLPVEDQDRLLDQAELELWTTKQLRNAIREVRGDEPDDRALGEASSRIDVPKNRVSVWRRAADREGVDFDDWVLMMLDRAATDVLRHELVGSGAEVMV